MKLSTLFHLQTNSQTKYMNYKLEQHLQFFVDHRQKDWLEWLVTVEFAINNKAYSATKISLFIVNYGRELRMKANIRKKRKSREINRVCKKKQKKEHKIMLSIKDLVLKTSKKITRLICQSYGILMDDIQTLEQGYLSLPQTMCKQYIQCRNTLETSC